MLIFTCSGALQKISENPNSAWGVLYHFNKGRELWRHDRKRGLGSLGLVNCDGRVTRERVRFAVQTHLSAASHLPGPSERNSFGTEVTVGFTEFMPRHWQKGGGQRAFLCAVPQLPSAQSHLYAKVAYFGVAYSDPRQRHHLYLRTMR